MSLSTPLSVRVSPLVGAYLKDTSQRIKRARGAVVQDLTDEAVKCRLFPGIAFRGDELSRRPWVIGTGLDVWEIVEMHNDYGSTDSMLKETDLSKRTVQLALAYYGRFPEEIDEALASNRKSVEEHLQTNPLAELFDK